MKKLFLTAAIVLLSQLCHAYSFVNEDGKTIYYTQKNGEATIVSGKIPYSGIIRIPSSIYFPGDDKTEARTLFVKTIDEKAFAGAMELEGVILSPSITRIYSQAFANSSLQFVDFNDCHAGMSSKAFLNCKNLRSITFPKTWPYLDPDILAGCENLTYVALPDTQYKEKPTDFTQKHPIWEGSPVTHLKMSTKHTSEGHGLSVFFSKEIPSQWSNKSFYIVAPENLKTIEICADDNETYHVPDQIHYPINSYSTTLYVWQYESFNTLILRGGCLSYSSLYNAEYKIQAVEIRDIKSISRCALQGLHMKSLKIPFAGAGDADNHSTFISLFNSANANDSGNKGVPTSLEYLELNSGATKLIPDALRDCANIKTLILPSTMQGLGETALYGCSGLEHLYVSATFPPGAYENTFDGMRLFQCVLHVPYGSKKYYMNADGWKRFYNIVEDANSENPEQVKLSVDGTNLEVSIDEIPDANKYVLKIYNTITGEEVYNSSQSTPSRAENSAVFRIDNLTPYTDYSYYIEVYDATDTKIFATQGKFKTEAGSADLKELNYYDDDNNEKPVEYYNLSGLKVDSRNLRQGLYIRRQGNKISKVLIR